MSETLRERTAKAIAGQIFPVSGWEVCEMSKRNLERAADAALAVMGEILRPTEERVERLAVVAWKSWGDYPWEESSEDTQEDQRKEARAILAEIRREAGITLDDCREALETQGGAT